ncbi:MAG: hypothetical protein WC822_02495 [Candidatus Paceibacterota bacterium]|jgi:hypothetical protein
MSEELKVVTWMARCTCGWNYSAPNGQFVEAAGKQHLLGSADTKNRACVEVLIGASYKLPEPPKEPGGQADIYREVKRWLSDGSSRHRNLVELITFREASAICDSDAHEQVYSMLMDGCPAHSDMTVGDLCKQVWGLCDGMDDPMADCKALLKEAEGGI